MTSKELVEKHLQERIDLDTMQSQELKQMLSRHDKERQANPYSKYFASKRQEQMENLLKRHKVELDRMYTAHEQEYQNWRKVNQIIRDSRTLSADAEPKRQIYQPNYEPEQQSKLDKVIKFFMQHRKRDHGQEQ
ncbi:hypothetical protein A3860_02465 [Niastella vici]|uniref:Uncharacterized protein n=1 Tax=Niastella vici TaxID=1703345 RepID=A0A1V9G9F3_9BACT|nr:hypothetical protein [Niastella vici]OQP67243.1 hypothetical protein A3860_02465 [Niastella vici]